MELKYTLNCTSCDFTSKADNNLLHCPTCGKEALLYTKYFKPLELRGAVNSYFSYMDWLPFHNQLPVPGPQPSCFYSKPLGKALGLKNLWILLSGYAPRYGAQFSTGTFKETEAIGVTSRILEQSKKVLIISSAGNAARAFLEHGATCRIKMVVIVPQNAESSMRIQAKAGENSPLLLSIKNSVYMDAIRFVDRALQHFPERLVREGGCYNVARRDSMAVPFLSAVVRMKELPDRYVQAVGSGTGAIAAWEAAMRLVTWNVVKGKNMRLHLVQNSPFSPIVDAWNAGLSKVPTMEDEAVRALLSKTIAPVLSNSTPPYSVKGGVYDALKSTNGVMYSVSNQEILSAQALANETIGVTPCTAASAALAGLKKAAQRNEVDSEERVLLHLTGAGIDLLERDKQMFSYPRIHRLDLGDDQTGMRLIAEYLESGTEPPGRSDAWLSQETPDANRTDRGQACGASD